MNHFVCRVLTFSLRFTSKWANGLHRKPRTRGAHYFHIFFHAFLKTRYKVQFFSMLVCGWWNKLSYAAPLIFGSVFLRNKHTIKVCERFSCPGTSTLLLRNTYGCLCISVAPETTNEARLRVLEGCHLSLKSPSSVPRPLCQEIKWVQKRVQTFYKHQDIAQNFPNPVMCCIWFCVIAF